MDWRRTTDLSEEPVSLSEMKVYIRAETGLDAENDLVTSLIKIARQKCEDYKSIAMGSEIFELMVDSDDIDDNEIDIPVYPCISVDSVTPVNADGSDGTSLTLNDGYYTKGVQRKTVILNKTFTTAGFDLPVIEQYKIVFTAGYGDDATEVLPEGYKLAIKKQVADWYLNRENYLPVLSSEVRIILDGLFGLNTWL